MEDPNSEIQYEFPSRYRIYKSGRVERLTGNTTVSAGFDSATSVTSKDVVIDSSTGVWARLYLPSSAAGKLPIVLYFHGGGFCVESAASAKYHNYLNLLSSKSNSVIISVDYRRAPEHLLPAAYDDCWAALQWVASKIRNGDSEEPWLSENGDFDRIFIAGDSAGGNIAHQVALRAAGDGQLCIHGLVLAHPYFWGSELLEGETRDAKRRWWFHEVWKAAAPAEWASIDHPCVNPMATEEAAGCRRVVVWVAEEDKLVMRGKAYYEMLRKKKNGEVELWMSPGKSHVFHVDDPTCDEAMEKMSRFVDFLRGR